MGKDQLAKVLATSLERAKKQGYSGPYYRGGAPMTEGKIAHISRDYETAMGHAKRAQQEKPMEIMLRLGAGTFDTRKPVDAQTYARIVTAVKDFSPKLADDMVDMLAEGKNVKWFQEFAKHNPSMMVSDNGGFIRSILHQTGQDVQILRKAGFHFLDDGVDIRSLTGHGMRYPNAKFDPKKIDSKDMMAGFAGAAAVGAGVAANPGKAQASEDANDNGSQLDWLDKLGLLAQYVNPVTVGKTLYSVANDWQNQQQTEEQARRAALAAQLRRGMTGDGTPIAVGADDPNVLEAIGALPESGPGMYYEPDPNGGYEVMGQRFARMEEGLSDPSAPIFDLAGEFTGIYPLARGTVNAIEGAQEGDAWKTTAGAGEAGLGFLLGKLALANGGMKTALVGLPVAAGVQGAGEGGMAARDFGAGVRDQSWQALKEGGKMAALYALPAAAAKIPAKYTAGALGAGLGGAVAYDTVNAQESGEEPVAPPPEVNSAADMPHVGAEPAVPEEKKSIAKALQNAFADVNNDVADWIEDNPWQAAGGAAAATGAALYYGLRPEKWEIAEPRPGSSKLFDMPHGLPLDDVRRAYLHDAYKGKAIEGRQYRTRKAGILRRGIGAAVSSIPRLKGLAKFLKSRKGQPQTPTSHQQKTPNRETPKQYQSNESASDKELDELLFGRPSANSQKLNLRGKGGWNPTRVPRTNRPVNKEKVVRLNPLSASPGPGGARVPGIGRGGPSLQEIGTFLQNGQGRVSQRQGRVSQRQGRVSQRQEQLQQTHNPSTDQPPPQEVVSNPQPADGFGQSSFAQGAKPSPKTSSGKPSSQSATGIGNSQFLKPYEFKKGYTTDPRKTVKEVYKESGGEKGIVVLTGKNFKNLTNALQKQSQNIAESAISEKNAAITNQIIHNLNYLKELKGRQTGIERNDFEKTLEETLKMIDKING